MVRRHVGKLGVADVATRLLLRLCVGKDNDADRRRKAVVLVDAAPILLEVTRAVEKEPLRGRARGRPSSR